jgi:hypothetical protein
VVGKGVCVVSRWIALTRLDHMPAAITRKLGFFRDPAREKGFSCGEQPGAQHRISASPVLANRLSLTLPGLDHKLVAPGKAWKERKRAKGQANQKLLIATHRVKVPSRQGLAIHRNRVWRGAGVIPPAKRTQGACRLCDRAPKLMPAEPTYSKHRKATVSAL